MAKFQQSQPQERTLGGGHDQLTSGRSQNPGGAMAAGSEVADERYQRELDELLNGRLCANPKYRD